MSKIWREAGYKDFADGSFGNGGQNIYVSRAGVLQRIFHFDFNRDGFTDLLFVNSQDMGERVPAFVYNNVLGNSTLTKLPTDGAYAAAVADLNNDGYDDLVIVHQHNGTHSDLTAFIYYGSPEGMSERYKLELPAPNCRAAAIGDFNGDGRKDIAFSCDGKLRIFYQGAGGFEPGNFVDFDVEITHMAAGDIDGDGIDELYVRMWNDVPRIFWGSIHGIDIAKYTSVGGFDKSTIMRPSTTPGWELFAEGWMPNIVRINRQTYLFREQDSSACFFPTARNRDIGQPLIIACDHAVAAAAADINSDGWDDLIIAVCRHRNEPTSSWIYWGSKNGFDNSSRTALPTTSARNVVTGDLNGNNHPDIVICQGRTDILNSTESLIFRNSAGEVNLEPIRIPTHDAAAAFIAHTCDDITPQLIFVNHVDGRFRGDVPAYIYYGSPQGFSVRNRCGLPGWSAIGGAPCDFNDDGWADILICNCSENAFKLDPGSFIYWGGPDGFDPERKLILPTYRAHGYAIGDFRHCGYIDIAIGGCQNPELLIFRGGPDGFDLENPQRILLDQHLKNHIPTKDPELFEKVNQHFAEVRWMLAADFNQDGWLDIFVSQIQGPRSLILWGGPDGFSMERCTWLSVEGAACAQAADLTGNGLLDLIVGGHQAMSKKWRCESYIYIYWGGPDGFREDRRTQLPASTCNSLAVADFNNDGILDIFASSYNAGRERDCDSFIYWGLPGGVYSATNRTRLFTHSACGCVPADFNEDGWIDLAVASHKTEGNHVGKSQIWWNGPKGFSPHNVTELPTMGPHGMVSVNPGNIMDRGPYEYYTSNAFELPAGAKVRQIRWQAQIPPKTSVKAQFRLASTKESLSLSPWQGPNGLNSWFENGQSARDMPQNGCWIQYRLALGAFNSGSSPRVTAVEVEYD